MAYPFPRFASAPQTPQHVQGIETPREAMSRNPSRHRSIKRGLIFLVTSTVVLIWWCGAFSKSSKQTDRVPFSHDLVEDYFNHFEGHQDCGVASTDLYIRPSLRAEDGRKQSPYCSNRAKLLEAMSGGGRHGFEAPFSPVGCQYRWYSTAEVCMILERFDAIVFVGDEMLQHVYAAFNMLLRENLAMGSLKQWEMKASEHVACRCDNQIIKADCSKYAVMDNQAVRDNDGGSSNRSPYYCDRTPHMYLSISNSPAPEDIRNTFSSLVAKDPESYKPIPVIHSLSLATSLSWPIATASMDEWVTMADSSTRNVPFLWLGPNAAGHLKPPGQILNQGNNALWHYTIEMAKEAHARELDALGMYNLTLQAVSWDGSTYGMKVALVQAMMVINWLSRLEST